MALPEAIVIKTQGIRGLTGQGVPPGGLAGQFLAKLSDEDYDSVWRNLASPAVGSGLIGVGASLAIAGFSAVAEGALIKKSAGLFVSAVPGEDYETRDTIADDLAAKQDISEKNAPSGYVGLDSTGKIPDNLLHDYILTNTGGAVLFPNLAATSTPEALAWPAFQKGEVRGDATPSNNGYYYKTSDSGPWAKASDIPLIDAPIFGSVSSTITTTTVYSATAPWTPSAGSMGWFIPNADNVGTVTLILNGGTARVVVDAKGNGLLSGMFRLGTLYLLLFNATGNNRWRIAFETRDQEVINSLIVRQGIKLIRDLTIAIGGYKSDADTQARSQILLDNTTVGEVRILVGGNGTTGLANALEVQADKSLLSHGNIIENSSNRVFSEGNFPNVGTEDVNGYTVALQLDQRAPFWNYQEDMVPVLLNNGQAYLVSSYMTGRCFEATSPLAYMDFGGCSQGTFVDVLTGPTGGVTLYAGPTLSWRGFGSTQRTLMYGPNVEIRVRRTRSGDLTARGYNVTTGAWVTPTASSDPPAPRDFMLVMIGQSNGVIPMTEGGVSGLMENWRALGRTSSFYRLNCAVGTSSLLKLNDFQPGGNKGWWWDPDLLEPGPLAINARDAILAAIAAGQPAPKVIVCVHGERDANYIAATGYTTKASVTLGYVNLFQWFRDELSIPDLKFLISPRGCFDGPPSGFDKQWSAYREATLAVTLADPLTFHGPEYYDLDKPYGNVHLSIGGQHTFMARLAYHLDNILTEGAANWLGPYIESYSQFSPNIVDIIINTGGQSMNHASMVAALALIEEAQDVITAEKIVIGSMSWVATGDSNTIKLRCTSPNTMTAGRPVYPYGVGGDMRTGRTPKTAFNLLPVRTYF